MGSPPGSPARRTVRRRLSGDRVGSRWWYWVAAVPLSLAFWAVAVAWVGFAIWVGPFDVGPLRRSAAISMVAFAPAFAVLTAMSPFAIYADAAAIREADVGWRPSGARYAGAAAVGLLALVGLSAVDLAADGAWDDPGSAITMGALLSVPATVGYLYRRHDRLGVP